MNLAARTLMRMLRDVLLTLLCVVVVLILLALALVALLALPIFLVYLIGARLLYWLVTRVPMWINPNSLGRVHAWHPLLNVAVFVAIGGALLLLSAPLLDLAARNYVAFVVAQAWVAVGGLAKLVMQRGDANCGFDATVEEGCREAVQNWLTAAPQLDYLVYTIVGLLVVATAHALMGTLDDAYRLKMIEHA